MLGVNTKDCHTALAWVTVTGLPGQLAARSPGVASLLAILFTTVSDFLLMNLRAHCSYARSWCHWLVASPTCLAFFCLLVFGHNISSSWNIVSYLLPLSFGELLFLF